MSFTSTALVGFARQLGYEGSPFKWDDARRRVIRNEVDAALFHVYGIGGMDASHILSSFPIVKRQEEAQHGEYRTKRVILEIYDEMQRAIETGVPYQTRLDPPPADPRVAHPPRKSVRT